MRIVRFLFKMGIFMFVSIVIVIVVLPGERKRRIFVLAKWS